MKIISIKVSAILASCLVFFSSCASGYQQITPQLLHYVSIVNNDENVQLRYKYNVLNKKYTKKEERHGIRVVAIQITNNSDRDLTFGENLTLKYSNGNNVVMMDRKAAFKLLKQQTPLYLLYLLLTPLSLITTKTHSNGFQEETSNIPIGLVLGPGLTFGNMVVAGGANSKFKSEMANNELMGQLIKPGSTVVGLVALKSGNYDSLELDIRE